MYKKITHIYQLCVCVCRARKSACAHSYTRVCHGAHWRLEDNLWVPAIKLKSSGLAAGGFMRWAAFMAQPHPCFIFHFIFIPHCPSTCYLIVGGLAFLPLLLSPKEEATGLHHRLWLLVLRKPNPGVCAKWALSNLTTFPFCFTIIIIITVIIGVWTFSPSRRPYLPAFWKCKEAWGFCSFVERYKIATYFHFQAGGVVSGSTPLINGQLFISFDFLIFYMEVLLKWREWGREERKKNTNRKRKKGKDQPNSPKKQQERDYIFLYTYIVPALYIFFWMLSFKLLFPHVH